MSARLFGITAFGLAALAVPVPVAGRVLALSAFGLGLVASAWWPRDEQRPVWLVGPAVLVLALAPMGGIWLLAGLGALTALGLAGSTSAGLERAVPALGLPLMTFAFRTRTPVGGPALAGWLAATMAMLVLAARLDPGSGSRPAPGAGPIPGSARDAGPGRWAWLPATSISAGVCTAVAGVAWVLAGWVLPYSPAAPAPGPTGTGPEAGSLLHPGLTGGLDAGAPVNLTDEIVLRVAADHPHYWRAMAYDRWDGRRWSRSDRGRPLVWPAETLSLGADSLSAPAVGTQPLATGSLVAENQRFTVSRAGLDVLLGAWPMAAVHSTARAGIIGDDGSLVLAVPLAAGASWTVESLVSTASADDLRRADPRAVPADDPVRSRFGRPDPGPERVATLARQVAGDAPTTYDQVIALERWMAANITYTRRLPPLPEGADAVDQLLFITRQGFCEQIGTALVVLLRSLGVPARLAVGYVPGDRDPSTGEWLSRGTDAHAWAEVWFPGIGWQGFDPTAQVPLSPDQPPLPAASAGWWRAGAFGWAAGAVGLVGLASAAVVLGLRRRRQGGVPPRPDLSPELVRCQERFGRCGRRLARAWSPASTLRERGDDLVAAGVDAVLVGPVVAGLEQAWYGRRDLSGDPDRSLAVDLDALERAVAELAASGVGSAQGAGGRAVAERL